MDLILKDLAMKEYLMEEKNAGDNAYLPLSSVFNSSLYGHFNQYVKYENSIENLNMTDEEKKKYHDSNLLLFIAQNKMISKYMLEHTQEISLDYSDKCVSYGGTIFSNVDPDLNYLEDICKKAGISFIENNNVITFGTELENGKQLQLKKK
ncbi:MAG: hypothetical protein Q4E69_05915 [Bacilli bacterium]|nr:hypothetical protein [Bacilli bacterium]